MNLERIQKSFSIVMCSSIIISLYTGYIVIPEVRDKILILMLVYFGFDLFVTKQIDMIVHHLAICLLLYEHFMNFHSDEHIEYCLLLIMPFEISSFFLSIRRIVETYPNLKNKYKLLMTLNDIMFLATFVYFRIYSAIRIFYDEEPREVFVKYDPYRLKIIAFSLLYALNLKWLYEILRILSIKITRR